MVIHLQLVAAIVNQVGLTSLSTSLSGYFTLDSFSVTGAFFFLLPKRKTLARIAVTATTPTPIIMGIV